MIQQVNCYLVGGPMDGVTYVSETKMDVLQFDKEDPESGDAFKATFTRHEYLAINYGGSRDGHQVYLHQSAKARAGIGPVLLQAAISRHTERSLLHEALGMLRRDGPMTEKKDSLTRKIEEHLK